jgi:hypothetical protein
MSTIDISIPVTLTTNRILCANPSLNQTEAERLAAELHDVVTSVRNLYGAGPRGQLRPVGHDVDIVEKLMLIAAGMWPEDDDDAAIEGTELAEKLTDIGVDALLVRYLRVCDEIRGTNWVTAYCVVSPREDVWTKPISS